MIVYLAGPMTGVKGFNRPAFDAAENRLMSLGHDVFNPSAADAVAGFDFDVPNYTQAFMRLAMERNTRAICCADAIALLPGWEHSRGVAVELALAQYIGIQVLDAATRPAGHLRVSGVPRSVVPILLVEAFALWRDGGGIGGRAGFICGGRMSRLTAEDRAKAREAGRVLGKLFGRLGGIVSTKAKARAARENGKKGGRPRKKRVETQD